MTEAPILVTGGTGTLGRHVVTRLREAGRPVRVMSRTARPATEGVEYVTGNLATGVGMQAALTGVDTIIHCAGSMSGDDDKARRLVHAAGRTGAAHLVNISVVGADRVPTPGRIDRMMFGYFAAQAAAERIIAAGGVPFTTLRATQFHELILAGAERLARFPVIPLPAGFRFQPIDAAEVAGRLVELALGGPAGEVADMGGPRVYDFSELIRSYLQAIGRRRPMVSVPLPGRAAAAYRAGVNLAPERAVGRRTWEEFLRERVGG